MTRVPLTLCDHMISLDVKTKAALSISADFVWSDEWFEHDGHEYKYISDVTITADDARRQCRTHGAQLVSINDEEEQKVIHYDVVKKRTLSAFIGGTDTNQGK